MPDDSPPDLGVDRLERRLTSPAKIRRKQNIYVYTDIEAPEPEGFRQGCTG